MNSLTTIKAETPEALPADMRQWFDSQALVGLVLQAQAALDSGMLRTNLTGLAFASGQANAMLAVLTYCYACNMTSSLDLEQNAQADPMIRYLCANRLPSAGTIKRFRRHNRKQIQECLAQMFQLAWQKRLDRLLLANGISRICPLSESPSCYQIGSNGIVTGLAAFFEEQAESRLLNAIQCDSLEMDV